MARRRAEGITRRLTGEWRIDVHLGEKLISSHHGPTDDGLSVAATGPGKIFILHKKGPDEPLSSEALDVEETEQGWDGLPEYSELYPKSVQ